jgi:hypothetical protein
MSSFIDNGVWDKNGACVECGFIPFKNTDKCIVCDPTSNACDIKNNYEKESYEKENCEKESCEEEICDVEYADGDVTWEINRKKSVIIDEDNSTCDEMFESLESHNESGDVEKIHILEDQIYRRFIKDIVSNKFTNINTIILAANKINDIIIKPNDGTWDTCRWYA